MLGLEPYTAWYTGTPEEEAILVEGCDFQDAAEKFVDQIIPDEDKVDDEEHTVSVRSETHGNEGTFVVTTRRVWQCRGIAEYLRRERTTCPVCHGMKTVVRQTVAIPCPECYGTGEV